MVEEKCKYEMDQASIVEDTECTQFCPQMDWWADKVKPICHISFIEVGLKYYIIVIN